MRITKNANNEEFEQFLNKLFEEIYRKYGLYR